MNLTDEQIRQDFEDKYTKTLNDAGYSAPDFSRHLHDKEKYKEYSTHSAWLLYQAALSLQAGEQEVEQIETGFPIGLEMPRELNNHTKALVVLFAQALADKLFKAEQKYGYSDGWRAEDWLDECRQKLHEHVAKGDPLDVAAYCAFLWHHNSHTSALPKIETLLAEYRKQVLLEASNSFNEYTEYFGINVQDELRHMAETEGTPLTTEKEAELVRKLKEAKHWAKYAANKIVEYSKSGLPMCGYLDESCMASDKAADELAAILALLPEEGKG